VFLARELAGSKRARSVAETRRRGVFLARELAGFKSKRKYILHKQPTRKQPGVLLAGTWP
jgi:hypothetical protein